MSNRITNRINTLTSMLRILITPRENDCASNYVELIYRIVRYGFIEFLKIKKFYHYNINENNTHIYLYLIKNLKVRQPRPLRECVSTESAETSFLRFSFLRKKCRPCSENTAGSINQSLVRSFVIESRITSFSRVLLGPARTPGSDYPIGTGFPFVDRHSSVFSRRILLYLPLAPFRSRAAASFCPSRAVLWETKGLAEEPEGDGRFTRGQRRGPSGGVKR